jgi:hypothetical protein
VFGSGGRHGCSVSVRLSRGEAAGPHPLGGSRNLPGAVHPRARVGSAPQAVAGPGGVALSGRAGDNADPAAGRGY